MTILKELDKKLSQVGKNAERRRSGIGASQNENSELEQELQNLEEAYAALGQLYIQNSNGNPGPEYRELYEQILAAEENRKRLQEQQQTQYQQQYQQPQPQSQPQPQPQGFQGGFYPNLTEEQLPAKFKPITAWGYFGWAFIFTIPLVGIIVALIKAFGNTENVNLRNFARSMFCYFVIVAILCLLIFGTTGCLVGML